MKAAPSSDEELGIPQFGSLMVLKFVLGVFKCYGFVNATVFYKQNVYT
jgi:hypothetical protein